jgi:undecaprenyl-diphosphatase
VWAARFSFLLSVPAVLGVAAAELLGQRQELVAAGFSFWLACLLGTAVAAVSGFLALAVVLRTVSSRSFHLFGGYVLVLALAVVIVGVILQ